VKGGVGDRLCVRQSPPNHLEVHVLQPLSNSPYYPGKRLPVRLLSRDDSGLSIYRWSVEGLLRRFFA